MKKKDSVKFPKLLHEQDSMGYHNNDLDASVQRLVRGQTYRDLSTVSVTYSRSLAFIQPWFALVGA